ncbi:MAG TPA: protein-glutamate O-methyltransferase CheR [bacterium]|nr:protein-glutamate O-methyltransferase CheR [bacterium]
MIKVSPDEYQVFASYIRSVSGIALDSSKTYLLETRLVDLLAQTGSASFSELYYKIKTDSSLELTKKLVDAITTGETSFFRDGAPFELLQYKIIPDLVDKRKKTTSPGLPIPIRIWSAACSKGQEVYSIAMTLKEILGDLSAYNIRILGTDISNKAVASASLGYFSQLEVERGLSPERIRRFLVKNESGWKISDEIRSLATFRRMNLLEDFSALGRFDIVFCRNVAIYFNDDDRRKLFNNIGRVLEKDGYLLIGSTESILGFCPQFESKRYLRYVFYQFKQ